MCGVNYYENEPPRLKLWARVCLLVFVGLGFFCWVEIQNPHHADSDTGLPSVSDPPMSMSPPREALEGKSVAAENTIREIEDERPGYLKEQDRALIRALIIEGSKR